MSLVGKRIFVTGGSRGIGLAIALRAAKDGASIAIAAKTAEAHPKLPGTILDEPRRSLQQSQLTLHPLQLEVQWQVQCRESLR